MTTATHESEDLVTKQAPPPLLSSLKSLKIPRSSKAITSMRSINPESNFTRGKSIKSNPLLTQLKTKGYDIEQDGVFPDNCSSDVILTLSEPKSKQNAFHLAAKKDHLEIFKALLKLPKSDAAINAPDNYGNTPLHFAASSSKKFSKDILQLLLSRGGNPQLLNKHGQTALTVHILTVKEDNPEKALLLLSKMKVSTPCNEFLGDTAYMHLAVQRNLISIACLLIHSGMSFNIPDSSGIIVADIVSEKILARMISSIKNPLAPAPTNIKSSSCKVCRVPYGALTQVSNCSRCGRACCSECLVRCKDAHVSLLQKTNGSENVISLNEDIEGPEDKTTSLKICTLCSKWLQIHDMKVKHRKNFMVNLFGCDGWKLKN